MATLTLSPSTCYSGDTITWTISGLSAVFNLDTYAHAGVARSQVINGVGYDPDDTLDTTNASVYGSSYSVSGTFTAPTVSVATTYTIYGFTAVSYDYKRYQAGSAILTIKSKTLGRVGSLSLSSRTASTITLAWDAVTNAAGYHIQYRAYGSTSWPGWATVSGGSTTSVIIDELSQEALSAGTTYEFRYCAYDSSFAQGDWSDPGIITTRPSASTSISISSYDSSSVTIEYGTITGADAYQVLCYQYNSTTGTNTLVASYIDAASPHTFSELSPETTYRCNYRGLVLLPANDLGCDAYGVIDFGGSKYIDGEIATTAASCTTLAAVGQAQFTGFSRTHNSITVHFYANNADMYYLRWRLYDANGNTQWQYYNNAEYFSNTSAILQNLSAGRYYEFQCYSYNSTTSLNGGWSTPERITTKPSAANTITSTATTSSLTVTCGAVTGAEAYLLTCGNVSVIVNPTLSTTVTSFSHTFDNLDADTSYAISYCAITYLDDYAFDIYDSDGYHNGSYYITGDKSSTTGTTLKAIGKASFTGCTRDVNSISITFSADNATMYLVEYKKSSEDSWTSYNSSTPITKKSCTVSNLSAGTYYDFRCQGLDANYTTGEWSDAVSITTKPEAASAISISSITSDTITVTCEAVTGAEAYLLTCGSISNIVGPSASAASFTHTFEDLKASTEYVIGYCGIVYLDPDAYDITDYDGTDTGGDKYVTGTATAVTEKTKSIVALWDWTIANGNVSDPDNAATATQTQTAKSVIDGQGLISSFSRKVWNDMCDKVNEIAKAAGKSWLETYETFDGTKMTAADRTLTAKRFNSLNHNVNSYQATGITEQVAKSTANPVRGPFFVTIMSKANDWIDAL